MSAPVTSINPFDALYVEEVAAKKPVKLSISEKSTKNGPSAPKMSASSKSTLSAKPTAQQAVRTAQNDESKEQQTSRATGDNDQGVNYSKKPTIRSDAAKPRLPTANRDRHSRTGITESKVKYNSGRQGWKNVISNSAESPLIEEEEVAVPFENEAEQEVEEQKPAYKTYQEFLKEQKTAKPKASNPVSPVTRKLNEGVDCSILSVNTVSFSRSEVDFIQVESVKPLSPVHLDKKETKKTLINLKELTGAPSKPKSHSNGDRASSRQPYQKEKSSGASKQSVNVNLKDSSAFPTL